MLQVRAATKTFLDRQVLDGLELSLEAGRVYAIVGANGAGKTVLLKILAGIFSLDSGSVELNGEFFSPFSPREARELGVAYVPQIPYLPRTMSQSELHTLPGFSLDHEPQSPGNQTPVPLPQIERQHVEIEYALGLNPKLLLIDEPRSLGLKSSSALWARVRERSQKQGTLVLLVSHDIRAAAKHSDALVVLANGRLIALFDEAAERGSWAKRALEVMGAGERSSKRLRIPDQSGKPLTTVRGVSIAPSTLTCVYGGLCAQWEDLLEALVEELRLGIPDGLLGVVRGDRSDRDFALSCTIEQNLSLALLRSMPTARLLWSPRHSVESCLHDAVVRCEVNPVHLEYRVGDLSGGNKQRLAFARLWLQKAPVLLLVQPWRGLDSAGIEMVHKLLERWLAEGLAICVCTTDAEEAAFFEGGGRAFTVGDEGCLTPGLPELSQLS